MDANQSASFDGGLLLSSARRTTRRVAPGSVFGGEEDAAEETVGRQIERHALVLQSDEKVRSSRSAVGAVEMGHLPGRKQTPNLVQAFGLIRKVLSAFALAVFLVCAFALRCVVFSGALVGHCARFRSLTPVSGEPTGPSRRRHLSRSNLITTDVTSKRPDFVFTRALLGLAGEWLFVRPGLLPSGSASTA